VRLELTDGTIVAGEPVADSDQELIEFLNLAESIAELRQHAGGRNDILPRPPTSRSAPGGRY
jgi:hypothetical protein